MTNLTADTRITAPTHEADRDTVLLPPPTPAEGLPFHRLPRLTPAGRQWWRPLAVLALASLLLLLTLTSGLTTAVLLGAVPGVLSNLDPRQPLVLLVVLGHLAMLLPAVVLAARWGGWPRGIIHSVAGRFRWRLLRAGLVVLPVYALVRWGLFFTSPPSDFAVPSLTPALLLVPLIVIVLTPLQCAYEEYAMRALPQQLLGSWLRSPLWGILVPVPFFVLGHGYTGAGPIDIAIFAVCMGFLIWRTGGVELAILVHTANNLTGFLIAPLSASSLHQGEVGWLTLLVSVPLTVGVTVGLTWWYARTHGQRFLQPERGTLAGVAR